MNESNIFYLFINILNISNYVSLVKQYRIKFMISKKNILIRKYKKNIKTNSSKLLLNHNINKF